MSITLNGDSGITTPTYGGADTAEYLVPVTGFKNRIINGAMRIDQRNNGASISVTSTGFPVDRFYINANSFGVISGQRSTTAPAEFTNSTLMTVTTPRSSIAASDVYGIRQTIEGLNVADLGWGTANAQTITVSFWARSSITGTYTVSLFNTAFNRSYVATYTISAANTFEYKTITIAGDTTGTWATDNSGGINLYFDLGSGSNFQTTAGAWGASGYLRTSGSTNWISTNGATFYITGVQLEKGSNATSFDYRPYGTELALCQRYYQKSYDASTVPATNSTIGFKNCNVIDTSTLNRLFISGNTLPVVMRVTPTFVYYSQDGTVNNVSLYSNTATKIAISTTQGASDASLGTYLQLASNATASTSYYFHYTASAEL
jgi:hypothetical protein